MAYLPGVGAFEQLFGYLAREGILKLRFDWYVTKCSYPWRSALVDLRFNTWPDCGI